MYPLMILFCEDSNKSVILNQFTDIIKTVSNNYVLNDNNIVEVGENPTRFIIQKLNNIKKISAKKILLICNDKCTTLPDLGECEEVTIILYSKSALCMDNLPLEKCNFITYGFSSKDTVTISSIMEDKAIISVQRRFDTLNGNIVEPTEILFDLTNINENEILPVVTALIFCEIYVK